MKAVWLEEFGGPEVLVAADAPDPVPGPGQALIEVEFANITRPMEIHAPNGWTHHERIQKNYEDNRC
jgi:D-arabinose 1-dehydrogenase-like Zn-dependent alcohol dehydrogenase